jgi:hypothetical protein
MGGKPVAGATGGRSPRVLALVGGCLLVAGCHTMVPVVGSAPLLGTRVSLVVNDAGRVALGEAVGPEVAELEGRLVDRDSTRLVLSVSMVRLLRGGVQVWSGERVTVRREHVSTVRERHLSKSRSAVLAGVASAALAVIIRQGIRGGGVLDPTVSRPDSAQSTRIPRP